MSLEDFLSSNVNQGMLCAISSGVGTAVAAISGDYDVTWYSGLTYGAINGLFVGAKGAYIESRFVYDATSHLAASTLHITGVMSVAAVAPYMEGSGMDDYFGGGTFAGGFFGGAIGYIAACLYGKVKGWYSTDWDDDDDDWDDVVPDIDPLGGGRYATDREPIPSTYKLPGLPVSGRVLSYQNDI